MPEQRTSNEERLELDTQVAGLGAALVAVDDELSHIELVWDATSGLPTPAAPEVVDDVIGRALRLGYPIKVLGQQVEQSDQGCCLQRLFVGFESDPVRQGEGTGFEILVYLGLQAEEDDPDHAPEVVAERLEAWASRVEELLAEAYPKALVTVKRLEINADDAVVTTPPGIDATEVEWRVDELVDQATEEVLDKPS